MVEILSSISILGFVLSIVMLIVSIIVWWKLGILKIIRDLSGITAKKTIHELRNSNQSSINQSYKPSTLNSNRGKLTSTASDLKDEQGTVLLHNDEINPETGILKDNKALQTDSGYTTSIENNDTVLLSQETSILYDENSSNDYAKKNTNNINIIEEIILIHTDEVIS